jgi:hypothetical protein
VTDADTIVLAGGIAAVAAAAWRFKGRVLTGGRPADDRKRGARETETCDA